MAMYRDELRKARGLTPEVPPEELNNRLRRTRNILTEKNVDALLIHGSSWKPTYLRYLANFVNLSRDSESFLLIPQEKDPVLFIEEPYYIEQAKEMSCIKDVRASSLRDTLSKLPSVFSEKALTIRTIGLSNRNTSAAHYLLLKDAFPDAHIVDCDDALDQLISSKSAYDKEMIRKAAAIADSGMSAAISMCAEGRREYEVGLAAERTMVDCGAEVGASTTDTFVFLGSGSSIQANIRSFNYTARRLRKGEMFFIDLALCYKGYYADFCRTVVIGEPSREQDEVFNVVEQLHTQLLRSLRSGISAAELYEIGYSISKDRGFEKNMNGYGFGHGVGFASSESPSFDGKDERRVTAGRFYCIEPGIFVPGTGFADIEDVTYLDEDGPELVTRCDRGLHIA